MTNEKQARGKRKRRAAPSDEEEYEDDEAMDDEDGVVGATDWRERARRARRDERAEQRRGGMGVEIGSLWRGAGGADEGVT